MKQTTDLFPLSPKTLRRIKKGLAQYLPPGTPIPEIRYYEEPIPPHNQTRNTFRKTT